MNYKLKALISMLASLAFVVIFMLWLQPAVEGFIKKSIFQYSKNNLPVTIDIEKVTLSLLELGATFHNTRITPNKADFQYLEELQLTELSAGFDLLSLLGGQLSIPTIAGNTGQIKIDLDPILHQPSTEDRINLAPLFDLLKKLPLKKIDLSKLEVLLHSQDQSLNFHSQIETLTLQNRREFITLNMQHLFELKKTDLALTEVSHKIQLVLFPNRLDILDTSLQHPDFSLQAKGEFHTLADLKKAANGELIVKGEVPAAERFLKALQILDLPLRGRIETQGTVSFANSFIPNSKLDTKVTNLHYAQFELGSFKLLLTQEQTKLSTALVEVEHSAGKVKIKDLKLNLESSFKGSFAAELEHLAVGPLMESMELKTVPVDLDLRGTLPCDLALKPFLLNCQPELFATGFQVRDHKDPKSKELIRIDEFAAQGSLTIDSKAVSYDAKVKIKENSGTSKGVISYAAGFNISYKTDELNIKNIQNLFSVHLEGLTSLEGATQGTSQAATFYMNLEPKDFYYENFYLGHLSTRVDYKAGALKFHNLAGQIGRTRYTGYLNLDFHKMTIDTKLDLPYLETENLLAALSRHFQMPVTVQGNGKAKIEMSGPLDIGQMDYRINFLLNKGFVAGESFDKLTFNVSARDGEFRADHVHLLKNNSSIIITGDGHPDGNIDLHIEGNRLRIEESENINKITSALSGLTTFSMTVNGVTKDPEMNLKAEVSDVLLDSEEIPPSHIAVKFSKYGMEGMASLVGNRIRSEFNFPFAEASGFNFKLRTIDWNFASVLSTLTGKPSTDFNSALTSDIKIHSTSGGFKNATGSVKLDRFFLRRGNESLENKLPLLINIDKGSISIQNFELTGAKSKVAIVGERFDLNHLDLSILGDLDLRLLQLFTPFLDDLGGQVSTNMKITGSVFKPQILGSALIKAGFLKLKGFVHPFEQLQGDVTFSHSKILLNSLKGILAGGALKGDGSISINGPNDLPINIKATLEGASLNLPDHVKTNGNAQLVFSGRWFPYTLSGAYQVDSGLMDMEFGGDDKKSEVKQSAYLPKVLSQSSFEPVLLDIQINLLNTLAIKNSVLNGNLMGNLHLKGPPTNPSITGKITTDKNSKLLFRDKIFEIQTAIITFADPAEINPDLYISARSHVSEYDVNLLVQGKAKNVQMRMSSSPPLSEQDIVSLLALGMTSSKLENDVQSRQQEGQILNQLTAQVVSSFAPIKTIGDTLGVKIELTSSFDDTKNVSVPRLNFSRKFGKKFELTGSVAKTGESQDMDVKLHYFINSNLSAVGLWENKGSQENSSVSTTQDASKDVLGLDLEYKLEFR